MRILITGAAGFIGSHLAERLAALGHSVVGLDSLTPFYAPALKQRTAAALEAQGIPVRRLDLAADDLADAVRGADAVYHLAAQPGLAQGASFDSYVRDNITATHRLLEAVRRGAAPQLFVNVATSSVYGADASGDEETVPRPTSAYGVTKLAAEQLVLAAQRDAGLPACSFRLFSVYGPRERPDKLYPTLIRALLADRPFPLYDGSERHVRSFTYVADIVDGLVSALARPAACTGEIFNLGTEEAISTGAGIRIVEELVGRAARVERRPRRSGDQSRTEANIAKARRVLGYNPRTTPRAGLALTVEWFRDQPDIGAP